MGWQTRKTPMTVMHVAQSGWRAFQRRWPVWGNHNGCDPEVIFEDSRGPLSTMRYEGCESGAEVRLVRIDGLGHTWPRDEVDATAAMWEFFKRHQLTD